MFLQAVVMKTYCIMEMLLRCYFGDCYILTAPLLPAGMPKLRVLPKDSPGGVRVVRRRVAKTISS